MFELDKGFSGRGMWGITAAQRALMLGVPDEKKEKKVPKRVSMERMRELTRKTLGLAEDVDPGLS